MSKGVFVILLTFQTANSVILLYIIRSTFLYGYLRQLISGQESVASVLLDDDDEAIGLLEEETGIRDLTLEVLTRHLVEDERCRVGRLRRPRDDIRAFRLCDRLQVCAPFEVHRYRGICRERELLIPRSVGTLREVT